MQNGLSTVLRHHFFTELFVIIRSSLDEDKVSAVTELFLKDPRINQKEESVCRFVGSYAV